MEDSPVTDPIAIPPALLAQIQEVADEQHRPAADVVREAIESYSRERRWQRIFAYGEERARTLGLAEADIPRLIVEYRHEYSHGRTQ